MSYRDKGTTLEERQAKFKAEMKARSSVKKSKSQKVRRKREQKERSNKTFRDTFTVGSEVREAQSGVSDINLSTNDKMQFRAIEGVNYGFDFERIFRDIASGHLPEVGTYRQLILDSLWFVVMFVLRIEGANHKFVVDVCREVGDGSRSHTLDLWAREHYKSSVITIGETIQRILRDREERIGIFSHTRPAAKSFLRRIKQTFEGNDLLKACFPDVLYASPQNESLKWSEDDGLIVKRDGFYNEATLEAWGLLEGMPTGKHFTYRVYDDIVTMDLVNNPDTIKRLKDMFDLSQNLGTRGGSHRVVGTPYHHEDVLMYIKGKKSIKGGNVYTTRLKPATVDGTPNGAPILLNQDKLDELKANEQMFNSQQLLNPTPMGVRKLDSSALREVNAEFIPSDIDKFMVIDPAGDDKTGRGDAWAIMVVGVEADTDDAGASNIYITDALISPLRETEAIEEIVRMYMKAGVVQQIGIEKVGLSSVEVHVARALEEKGRRVSVEDRSLVILRPAGRNKARRIEMALAWPLSNAKIHISTNIDSPYRERLKTEMDRFPYWHDDGIDALSYLYDVIKGYRFMPKANVSEYLRLVKEPYKPMDAVAGY